ncbi:MAG: hypothetical protein HOH43_08400 [Candidatus Latescibacteria bacterium]|nr:hypothetical protein [Candidatus Latescibacterota bacterium]
MKITRIRVRDVAVPRVYETHCADPNQMQSDVDHPRSRYQIIELFTDAGLTGLGEVSDIARRMKALSAQGLQDLLSEIMIGGNLDRWRDLYGRVQAGLPDDWHPELRSLTLFGVEIALLDLVGRRYAVPVYELLGGRYHDCIQVSWVAFLRGDISAAEELERLRVEIMEKSGRGLRSFKLKVGEDHARDLERISLVRGLAGPEAYIKVDASGAWEEGESIDKVKDMAEAGADACETPVIAVSRPIANDDPLRINSNADAVAATLGRVRAASSIDIIEHVADLGDVFSTALIRHRAVDVVNVVASQAGGLVRSQRLIQTAETAGIPALLGSTIELGPGTAAMVHLAIASKNVTVPSDLVSPELLVDDICRNPLRFRNGTLQPNNAPGLGMEIDEDKMEKWAVEFNSH